MQFLVIVLHDWVDIPGWTHGSKCSRWSDDASWRSFPERFGLFSIILLGEFVAAVVRGIESQEYWNFPAAATAFSSMAFAFVLRWWYFDVPRSAAARHIRTKRQAVMFQIWHYAHLPMFLGIGVAGVGFEHLISLQQ
jgi:low temperature requirement protein LtrA